MKKLVFNSLIIAMGMSLINGCAITAATVAGVTAYELNQSNSDPVKVAKSLNQEIPGSYFAVAILDKTVVLAGQVASSSDIDKAKKIISKSANDYTVYSYLKVAAVEPKEQQDKDLAINSKVLQLIKTDLKDGGTSTVANGEVYLLVDNKQNMDALNSLSDKILKVQGVSTVITVQKRNNS